uniref:NAD(P)/FAD-dependent oxidoreductase n=1 Tax=Alicyclobacillus tolerans TaxID=90970 RepID=UPI001F1B0053|nr:FAD-binding oxidoreductase [Alicyclobacillus tolerans]
MVIGGGVNGLSAAFHLAKAGVKKVTVVEWHHLGAGATGKSGALVRTHYSNEHETKLAVESLKYFEHWGDLVGGDCGFKKVGLLVLATSEFNSHLQANVNMHRSLGVNTHLITPKEAYELDPSLKCDDVSWVAYEPDSGYADPNTTAFTFAHAARDLGVNFELDTKVTEIRTSGNTVTGVATTRGNIKSPLVLVAAGAWANELLEPLNIKLGLVPGLARVTLFRWPPDRSSRHLTYLDRVNQSWMRPEGGNCTLIGAESGVHHGANPYQFSESVPQEYIDLCREKLARRFPVMRHSSMRGNWAGILMVSPDSKPIIDQLQPYDGLFCIAGDSGTSFKTSPAIGKCVAEWITQGKPITVDLTPFRATRFSEGELWIDENDYGLHRGTISR